MLGRRKKYRYEYEDGAGPDSDSEMYAVLPLPVSLTRADRLVAACLGVLVAAFAWLLSFKGLHPSAWADCAIAAGLRPP